jgi:hypothetical protein
MSWLLSERQHEPELRGLWSVQVRFRCCKSGPIACEIVSVRCDRITNDVPSHRVHPDVREHKGQLPHAFSQLTMQSELLRFHWKE